MSEKERLKLLHILLGKEIDDTDGSTISIEQRAQIMATADRIKKSCSVAYNIAIITALPKERAAVQCMMDSVEPWPGNGNGYIYSIGTISSPSSNSRFHKVVITQTMKMGNNSGATTAAVAKATFPAIDDIIMSGIAGGIPSPSNPKKHVRLGDVVVSDASGVVQYDYIKDSGSEGIQHRNSDPQPSSRLLAGVEFLKMEVISGNSPWEKHLDKGKVLQDSARPKISTDIVWIDENKIKKIDHPFEADRKPNLPSIKYGPIGSANILLKNKSKRESLDSKFGLYAVEMEGAGLAEASWSIGCGYILVRGICDYSDIHKNDEWQGYAAIASAAYTRALIEVLP